MSQAFTGMDPADYRINRVLMVGADKGDARFLGDSDHPLLRSAVQLLTHAGLNFSEEIIRAAADNRFFPSDENIAIINKRDDMGGRDFLDMKEQGDLVIFCNIPRHENQDHDGFSQSFTLSAKHGEKDIWGRALDFTQAKAVVVYGGPECLNEKEYIGQDQAIVMMKPVHAGGYIEPVRTMVSKDILAEGEAYFGTHDYPLEKACRDYVPGHVLKIDVPYPPPSGGNPSSTIRRREPVFG